MTATTLTIGGTKIVAGSIPGRKSRALCITEGTTTTVLAYFVSDEASEKFELWMDSMGGKILFDKPDTADE